MTQQPITYCVYMEIGDYHRARITGIISGALDARRYLNKGIQYDAEVAAGVVCNYLQYSLWDLNSDDSARIRADACNDARKRYEAKLREVRAELASAQKEAQADLDKLKAFMDAAEETSDMKQARWMVDELLRKSGSAA